MPTTRRGFLAGVCAPALVGATIAPEAWRRACAAAREVGGAAGSAGAVAREEELWAGVARAFAVDRSILNLNNGGVSPSPVVVQEAMARHLALSNEAPVHTMWRILEPRREVVRERLARQWGVDTEEIAITRNASESLQTCQLGFDLKPGDEILTTNQDYPRMLTTFRQRERREGVVLKTISIPTPCTDPAEVVRRFAAGITERTRLILCSHVVFLTGQILPVKEIAALARSRGIPCIVDGAHALAQFDFSLADLECDYYGVSLHKWLMAPHGTGMLYVRREKIAGLWPMMAAPREMEGDIRKFEEIGTHPAANALAVAEALTFHQTLGPARKEARLRFLRDSWAEPLERHERVRLHTSRDPRFSCAMGTVQVEGVDSVALADWLWSEHHVLVSPIRHEEFEGVRVTASVYTTMEEVERFVELMEGVVRRGLG